MYGTFSAHHRLYALTCRRNAVAAEDAARTASYSWRESVISSVTKPSLDLGGHRAHRPATVT
ncbi:hypothetical protein SPURM210S_07591 [Streptomyces purpurascens]